jgi:hypothetical protein
VTQVRRKLGSPRIPLADITPRSPSPIKGDWDDARGVRNVVEHESPTQQDLPRTGGLVSAISLLTEEDAKELLLLSAKSNISLAVAIKDMVLGRQKSSRDASHPMEESYESNLVDTFISDDYRHWPANA